MAKENKKSLNAEVTDELLESASGGMYESRNGCCVMGICPLCGG